MEGALQKVGGFGRFQYINLIALVLARNSCNIFAYSFSYWIMPQKYFCADLLTGEYTRCTFAQICDLIKKGDFVDYE